MSDAQPEEAHGWRIVTKDPALRHDPRVRALFEEAWAATPPGFLEEDVIKSLPRKPLTGRCRLCGQEALLTKEHIPPKSSGNKLTARSYTLDDWLHRTDVDNLNGGKTEQGGIFGYTLCGPCNSYTGTYYGAEYQRWAEIARATLGELPHPDFLDTKTDPLGWKFEAGSTQDGGVSPGAFARQVLSCFCTLSGSWDLASRNPAIRRIVLEKSLEPVPVAMELGLGLYFGPHSRMAGPSLLVDPHVSEWRWVMEMAYPPFSFLCVIASNVPEPGIGLMMNDWTVEDLSKRCAFEGYVRLGFGWTPLPGDYRTTASIAAGS